MRTPLFRTKLTNRVALYVPSTTDTNKPADNAEEVQRVVTEFCAMYGGATATDARGGWISDTCGLVTESVTIIYAFCTKQARRRNMARLLALAASIREDMRQEAITVEVNNKIAFI